MATSPVKCSLFWDIENVRVPKGELATDIVRSIRHFVSSNSWVEVDFYVACDVYNQSSGLMRSLGLSGLSILHVPCNVKNSADDKLKDLMIKFVDDKGQNEIAIVLLTGDYDFATVLRNFKRSHNVTICLIYSEGLSQALVDCVDKSFHINKFIKKNGNKPRQPYKSSTPLSWDPWLVQITGYPSHIRNAELVAEFRKKAQRHRGKFAEIQRGIVWLSFTNKSDAIKMRDELNGRVFKGGMLSANVTESRLMVAGERTTINQLALEMDQKTEDAKFQRTTRTQVPSSPKNFDPVKVRSGRSKRRDSNSIHDSDINACCCLIF